MIRKLSDIKERSTTKRLLKIKSITMFVFVVAYTTLAVSNSLDASYRHIIDTGIQRLLDVRENWQWGPYSNAEAILGITLSKDDWYQEEDADSYATVQAMEIELLAALSNDRILSDERWSLGKLAQYIGALQMTCRDPKSFYGHDLLYTLRRHMLSNLAVFQSQRFSLSWAALALCNTGEPLEDMYRNAMISSSGVYKFDIDEAAILLMALTCFGENSGKSEARNFIVTKLRHNISAVNEYSKALAVQALRLSDTDDVSDLIGLALHDISQVVRKQGSMTHPAAALHFLPALAGTSLLDIGRTVCDEKVTSVSSKNFSSEVTIQISVLGSSNNTWTITMGNGSTLFDALLLLQQLAPTFRFDFKQTSIGHMIESINGVSSGIQEHTYWQMLKADDMNPSSGIDDTIPQEGDHYIFRLDTW